MCRKKEKVKNLHDLSAANEPHLRDRSLTPCLGNLPPQSGSRREAAVRDSRVTLAKPVWVPATDTAGRNLALEPV